ncbi:MAG: NAD(P)/FAD-dependent oxidoreductase [Alphaproteobacteria bacterium]|nr:NAD(P)/FAD-dependent oxidoreductase [Alphaproteobacteria bacterium]
MSDKENLQETEEMRDIAIIGAGPVGLFAVFECGMLGLSCHVIDALPHIGGQCSALYPEKPIYDIPAYPEILASDLIGKLEEQAAPFRPLYHLGQQVVSLSDNDSFWQLNFKGGQAIRAKTIIIAGGAGAFGPNRPPLEDIESYEGRSVFYTVQRKQDFEGKKIMIAGGGDSAVDWALSLAPLADKLYVLHRRDKFRAVPESVKKMHALADQGQIEMLVPAQLKGLKGENGVLSHVQISGKDGNVQDIEADVLLPFYGLSMDLGPIAQWGLNLDQNHINVHPTTCQTNIDRIYAIGDIAAYENKKKLILTGFSEGSFAAHDIYQLLHPDTPLHFEYSTTKGLPDKLK